MSTLEFNGLDGWEVAFWILAAGYLFEDAVRWVKIRGLDNISFWVIVDILTDLFFVTSFVFRVAGWINHGDHRNELQLLSVRPRQRRVRRSIAYRTSRCSSSSWRVRRRCSGCSC